MDNLEEIDALNYLDYKIQADGTVSVSYKHFPHWPKHYSVIRFPEMILGRPLTKLDSTWTDKFVEAIYLPASVLSIEDPQLLAGYLGDRKMHKIEVASDNPNYWSDGKALYTKDKTTLIQMFDYQTEEYTVCEDTKRIGNKAFDGFDHLKKLVLPKGLQEIGAWAFSGCSKLEEIVRIESVSSVAVNALSSTAYYKHTPVILIGGVLIKCNGITETSYAIPQGTSEIVDSTFVDCDSLKTLQIPASVNKISEDAFKEIPALSAFVVDTHNTVYQSINGVLYSKDGKNLIQMPSTYADETFVVPDTVEVIKEGAFYKNHSIKKVVFTPNVKMICDKAFYGCETLETIYLGNVRAIGSGAFFGCRQLNTVMFPEQVAEIGPEAFGYCGFNEVVLPESILKVGNNAFGRCPKITLYDTISSMEDIGGTRPHEIIVRSAETDEIQYKVWLGTEEMEAVDCYKKFALSYWKGGAEFDFQGYDELFPKMKGLNHKAKMAINRLRYPIELSDSQKTIYTAYLSQYAKAAVMACIDADDMESLLYCEQLGLIKKSNIDALLDYAAKAARFLVHLTEYRAVHFGELKSKLPAMSVKEAAPWAVSNSVPDKVERYKGNETSVLFPSEVDGKAITGIADSTTKTPDNYRIITEVVLPEGYTTIGHYAFYRCENLEKITLPCTLRYIGKYAFSGCRKLKEIILPDSVTEIDSGSFSNCTALERLKLSENLKEIPEWAFYACSSLKEVALPESVWHLNLHCFAQSGLKKLTIHGDRIDSSRLCFGSSIPEIYVNDPQKVNLYKVPKRFMHRIK